MDGALKRNFRISLPADLCVIKLQNYCKFSSTLLKVPIITKPLCAQSDCHNNVMHYVDSYGGEQISGYYLITDINDDSYGCAIYHSLWKDTYGNLLDITPFSDDRAHNVFSVLTGSDYYSGVLYDGITYKVLEPGIASCDEP